MDLTELKTIEEQAVLDGAKSDIEFLNRVLDLIAERQTAKGARTPNFTKVRTLHGHRTRYSDAA